MSLHYPFLPTHAVVTHLYSSKMVSIEWDIVGQNWTMFLICWAQILNPSVKIFILSYLSNLCSPNKPKLVLNGTVLSEECQLHNFEKLDDVFYHF